MRKQSVSNLPLAMKSTKKYEAIEASYNGYRFRSRLEARWAIFFDCLEVSWDYELQGYKLPGGLFYLPDFWLPQVKMWAEVKPENLDPIENQKCVELAVTTGHPCLILIGQPDNKPYTVIIPVENKIRITDCCLTNHDNNVNEEGEFYYPQGESDKKWPDTARAVYYARQARFEHGETPFVPEPSHKADTTVSEKEKPPQSIINRLAYILPPTDLSSLPPPAGEGSVKMITIILRATEKKEIDTLRLRKIHQIMSTYPGNDRVAYHMFEKKRGYLVEFPGFTTGYCPDLMKRISFLVGEENVRVEQITFY